VTEQQVTVLTSIRIPRVLATAVVGAAWGAAGVAMQGLYRTPLADPGLVAIGAGAALGVAVGSTGAMAYGVLAQLPGDLLVAAAAILAALLTGLLVHRLASASGRVVVATMLLAGVALSALFAALTAIVLAAAGRVDLGVGAVLGLGSFSGVVGSDVVLAGLAAVPAIGLLARSGPALDALALGEAEAGHLGIDVARLTFVLTLLLAVLCGVAVAVGGVIAFLALVVPSLIRGWLGSSHRPVVVGSALLGATTLVLADVVARQLFAPVELSVSVITTVVGAPFFLWSLLRQRGWLVR
jgi:iron complex transport system permease protein